MWTSEYDPAAGAVMVDAEAWYERYHKDAPAVPVHTPPTPAAAAEVRVTDPVSGGEKGQKLARFSLVPSEFLWALAEHYGRGAAKYADRNWERGYRWSLTVDAMERHWHQFKLGERIDPETGSHHLIAAAWHVIALFIFDSRHIGTDDIHRAP